VWGGGGGGEWVARGGEAGVSVRSSRKGCVMLTGANAYALQLGWGKAGGNVCDRLLKRKKREKRSKKEPKKTKKKNKKKKQRRRSGEIASVRGNGAPLGRVGGGSQVVKRARQKRIEKRKLTVARNDGIKKHSANRSAEQAGRKDH